MVGTIVGWGRIGVEQTSSKVLLKASLKILTDEECLRSKLAQHLKPTMMCAFSKGKDGCQVKNKGSCRPGHAVVWLWLSGHELSVAMSYPGL